MTAVPALVVVAVTVFDGGVTVESIATAALLTLIVVGPIPIILRSELRTEVREDGIYFRFGPLHRSERRIPFDEIEEIRRTERRAYQYGLRRTRWGWEYRPNSSEGVEIYRTAGPTIFLGSERPHELRQAIEDGVRRTRTRRT